jgi:hypothetical protein
VTLLLQVLAVAAGVVGAGALIAFVILLVRSEQ